MSQELIGGGAGILPVDHTYLLPPDQPAVAAEREIRALELPIPDPPAVGFRSDSFQKSRGGKIANLLAHLSALGHPVSVAGAVGGDQAGGSVLADLPSHQIGTNGHPS